MSWNRTDDSILYVGPTSLLEAPSRRRCSLKTLVTEYCSRVVSVLGAASQGVIARCVPQWAPTSNDEADYTVPYLAVWRTVVIVARYGAAFQSCTFDFQAIINDIADTQRQVLSEHISHLNQLRHVRGRTKAG